MDLSPLPLAAGASKANDLTRALLPSDECYRQVRALAQLVKQQFRTLKTVSAYAKQLALSSNHLNVLCRWLLHQTASGVLHVRVVAEAQLLLTRTENSVAAITAALGFDDAS